MKKAIFKFICSLLILVLAGLFVQCAEAAFNDNDFLKLCETGTLREVEDAIKAGANVNATDNYGWSALMYAAQRNNPDIITALINSGADVELKDRLGRRAIDYDRVNERLENTDAFSELDARSKWGKDTWMLFAFILLLVITGVVSTGKYEGKFGKFVGKLAKFITISGVVAIFMFSCYLIYLNFQTF